MIDFHADKCLVKEADLEHVCKVMAIDRCTVSHPKVMQIPRGWTRMGHLLDSSIAPKPARRSIFLTVIYERDNVDEKTRVMIEQVLSQISNEVFVDIPPGTEGANEPDKELYRIVETKPSTDVFRYEERYLTEMEFLLGLTYFHGPPPLDVSDFVGDINSVLADSVFTIALPSRNSDETSFFYQALAAGSIPITLKTSWVVKKFNPLGSPDLRVPFPILSNWNELGPLFHHFFGFPERQHPLFLQTSSWWDLYLSSLQEHVSGVVADCFDSN